MAKSLFSWWGSEGCGNAPPVRESLRQGATVDPCMACPLLQCACHTFMRQLTVISPIVLLLARRGPAHIPRFVVPVWIRKAIQLVCGGRAWPYVLQKDCERVAPAITDRDPSSTIVQKVAPLCVVAPCLHISPQTVLRCLRRAMGAPILSGSAPARCRQATSDILDVDFFECATRTSTQYHSRLSSSRRRVSNDRQLRVHMANQIKAFHLSISIA